MTKIQSKASTQRGHEQRGLGERRSGGRPREKTPTRSLIRVKEMRQTPTTSCAIPPLSADQRRLMPASLCLAAIRLSARSALPPPPPPPPCPASLSGSTQPNLLLLLHGVCRVRMLACFPVPFYSTFMLQLTFPRLLICLCVSDRLLVICPR